MNKTYLGVEWIKDQWGRDVPVLAGFNAERESDGSYVLSPEPAFVPASEPDDV